MAIEIKNGFILSKDTFISECNAEVFEYTHAKTKAKLIFIKNDDNNKSFTIGFKTLPENSTGVPHIIEHCILCGSEKYDIKKSFAELMKSSLSTFLNAFTFSDMTLYPIASQNHKDYLNLMDVYLDSVFNPNLKKYEEIFMQEGWHFEIGEDGELIRNGVVFNEMKGTFSNPMAVLRSKSLEILYDNCYQHVSGGDPEVIPQLTYEEFLKFYNKHYHPTNSCTVVYGNADIEKVLPIVDGYLSKYEFSNEDYSIKPTTPFTAPKEAEFAYNITEQESEDKKGYLSVSYLVDKTLDMDSSLAFNVISQIISSDASSIKNRLLDKNLCSSINAYYDEISSQSRFVINVLNINAEDRDEIISIIDSGLKELVEKGIDPKLLDATLNSTEFNLREPKDNGFPMCIEKSVNVINLWKYDPDAAINALCYEESLKTLRKWQQNGGFEKLIQNSLIENPHKATVVLKPEKNLNLKKQAAEKEALKKFKDGLTKEQLDEIMAKCKKLKDRQQAPDTGEGLKLMHTLTIDDIDKENRKFPLAESDVKGVKLLHYEANTYSIVYGSFKFNINHLSNEEMLYASLTSDLITSVSTEHYTYQDLSSEIMTHLGGVNISISSDTDMLDRNIIHRYFNVDYKALSSKIAKAAEIVSELIFATKFDDKARLNQILTKVREQLKLYVASAGHAVARTRMSAMLMEEGMCKELSKGIEYYKFIDNILNNFDAKADEVIKNLYGVLEKIFIKNNLIVAVTSAANDKDTFVETIEPVLEKLPSHNYPAVKLECLPEQREAIATASNVQYVGKGYDFKKLGFDYSGALAVVRNIIQKDYLWNEVRVLGGAYGVFSIIRPNGMADFDSYRDPQLQKTLDVYAGVPNYLRAVKRDGSALLQHVLSTVNELDMPMFPQEAGEFAVKNYITHNSDEMRQKIREEILSTNHDDVVKSAELFEKVLSKNVAVTVGNANVIEQNKELFDRIITL